MNSHCHINPHLQERLEQAIRLHYNTQQQATLLPILPILIHLLAEQHDQPVEQYKHVILSIILENARPYDVLDPNSPGFDNTDLDMDQLIQALESIRQEQLDTGDWSAVPTPPQMFG